MDFFLGQSLIGATFQRQMSSPNHDAETQNAGGIFRRKASNLGLLTRPEWKGTQWEVRKTTLPMIDKQYEGYVTRSFDAQNSISLSALVK